MTAVASTARDGGRGFGTRKTVRTHGRELASAVGGTPPHWSSGLWGSCREREQEQAFQGAFRGDKLSAPGLKKTTWTTQKRMIVV